MKIEKPENPNYAAVVVRLKSFNTLPTCDNVVGSPMFGLQAIVSKDHQVGDMGIVFTPETQLSDEYVSKNNLYRHADLNEDKSQKGYMEDNRRVRAIKFRGNTSNCLFMPLSSLSYTGVDTSALREGDEFDTLNGYKICQKYVVKTNGPRLTKEQQKRKFSRVDSKHMPEHIDTLNFMKSLEKLDPEAHVTVTQKLHGTSIRVGHTIVKKKLNWLHRFAGLLGVPTQQTEHAYIYGSRKVIKDAENPDQNHFYSEDIWTSQGQKLKGLLPKNYLVYAELVGWTDAGAEIQRNYTYSVPRNTSEMYIYRIAIVNDDGHLTDLSWEQVKEFCSKNGLKHVPQLWEGKLKDFNYQDWMDKRYFEEGHRHALWLGAESTAKNLVDEGVCVRIDGITPQLFKAKSPLFLEHETKLLDTGEEDLESQQTSGEEVNHDGSTTTETN